MFLILIQSPDLVCELLNYLNIFLLLHFEALQFTEGPLLGITCVNIANINKIINTFKS